jgi:hypothetical protein
MIHFTGGSTEPGLRGYVELEKNGHTIRKARFQVDEHTELEGRCRSCNEGIRCLEAPGNEAEVEQRIEAWASEHIKGPVVKPVEPIAGEEKTDGNASAAEATQA